MLPLLHSLQPRLHFLRKYIDRVCSENLCARVVPFFQGVGMGPLLPGALPYSLLSCYTSRSYSKIRRPQQLCQGTACMTCVKYKVACGQRSSNIVGYPAKVLVECAFLGLRASLQQGHELMARERERERSRKNYCFVVFFLRFGMRLKVSPLLMFVDPRSEDFSNHWESELRSIPNCPTCITGAFEVC